MTKWKSEIKIGDLHKNYQDGTITIQKLGKAGASRAMTNRFVRAEVDEGFDLCDAIACLSEGVGVVQASEQYSEMLLDSAPSALKFTRTDHVGQNRQIRRASVRGGGQNNYRSWLVKLYDLTSV